MTPGQKFRHAVATAKPLQIVGTVNAYFALMAERVGHQALYLSGAGVANASYGLPDLGMTSMNDVLIDAGRITSATDLPLLVDIDTGWGGAFNIARTIKEFEKARVAAVHMEDQVAQKRCGHRPNKAVVSIDEMCVTASKPPWTPVLTKASSSWPAPMRWQLRDWSPALSAPRPIWKPVPT